MGKATRVAFGEALARIGEKNKNIVVFDADLSVSTMSKYFAEKFPERFFEMGIAEANMIGTGAGIALQGKTAFICSFGTFLTGRFDQIKVSLNYGRANVKIVGTHSGIAIGDDGYSQMGLEDLALMRVLPKMTVLQPADAIETECIVDFLANKHEGPAYLRLTRQNTEDLFNASYHYNFGKGVILREGKDVAVFASGGVVANALHAAEALIKDGISATVVNIHTIKPIDVEIITRLSKETQKIVTVEDHQIVGGLGSAVAETLSDNAPAKLLRIGIRDQYGESGTPDELYEKHGLSTPGIARQIREFVSH
ncbi:MAG: transketolase [Deltaproteobacteria bacterium RIFCSPHIGHO2_12_FULL_43_9]|nr:MAG: transketolase [Deltaproteobacteria bacterium RIFCSPHIGHO2_12_FULL_43_9]